MAGLRELECADDAAAVVCVHARGCCGVTLREQRVRRVGAEPLDLLLPMCAAPLRRDRELRQRCAEVEAGAADEDRDFRGVDRRVRELLVAAHRHILLERDDADELRRVSGAAVRIGMPA